MPPVGFEPTIPEFARAKTVHGVVRAAIVMNRHSVEKAEAKGHVRTYVRPSMT
jgi:hypothetical protein